jgi:hypothetical protein
MNRHAEATVAGWILLLLLGSSSAASAQAASRVAPLVVEAEDLLPDARVGEGRLLRQEMAPFGSSWSGNAQLFWIPASSGARLHLVVNAPREGSYGVGAAFTRAPDYGQFRVTLNGHVLGTFDAYDAQVGHSGKVDLGSVALRAGANRLEILVTGRNRRSSGLMVGIDRLELLPEAASPSVAAARSLRQNPVLIAGREFRAVPQYPVVLAMLDPNSLYMPTVDLRQQIATVGLTVREQGTRGTCSVFAMTFLLEYMYATTTNLSWAADLSEEYLNRATNLVAGNLGDGDFFHNIDAGYLKWKILSEQMLPYQSTYDPNLAMPLVVEIVGQELPLFKAEFIKAWKADVGADAAQLQKALTYLDQGVPVAGGFWWPKQGYWQTQTIGGVEVMVAPPVSLKKQHLADGHSVALVGYRKHSDFPGGGYLVFRNSWGSAWGDAGYGYMPFQYVLDYANDLVAYRP